MPYQLKGGEEIRDGKLYGWTGEICSRCKGCGWNDPQSDSMWKCNTCGGTGEEWGLMPNQPEGLG